jgi:hypothetical protein
MVTEKRVTALDPAPAAAPKKDFGKSGNPNLQRSLRSGFRLKTL